MKLSSLALVLLALAASPALFAGANPQQKSLQPVRAELNAPAPISGHDALMLLAL